MRFESPLLHGRFVRRYKRFFADFLVEDGTTLTAHCPNTGSLKGCLLEGAPVAMAHVDNPKRKLKYTWKMIQADASWIGVDTSIANSLVQEAIEASVIPELAGYDRILSEVKYGQEGRSRIDLLLSRGGTVPSAGKRARALPEGDERVYVEVKNTTLVYDQPNGRCAAFPDAVTERGLKHLGELIDVVAAGHRAAMVFSVQRQDCVRFVPADEIDPAYGSRLREAANAGVELYALAATISPEAIALDRLLPIELNP